MKVELGTTWYGTQEFIEINLKSKSTSNPYRDPNLETSLISKNIFQRAYTYLTGEEWCTTLKISETLDMSRFWAKFPAYEREYQTLDAEVKIEHKWLKKRFEIHLKLPSHPLNQAASNFINQALLEMKRANIQNSGELTKSLEETLALLKKYDKNPPTSICQIVNNANEKIKTFYKSNSLEPSTELKNLAESMRNKFKDEGSDINIRWLDHISDKTAEQLESIVENLSKLIRLILKNEKLIIALEGTNSPEENAKIAIEKEGGIYTLESNVAPSISKVYPHKDRLSLGGILLNLNKDSLKKLSHEELKDTISENIETAFQAIGSIFTSYNEAQPKEIESLIETIVNDCIDAGLMPPISSEEDSIENDKIPIFEPKVIRPFDETVKAVRDSAIEYINAALDEMEGTDFHTQDTLERVLSNTHEVVGRLAGTRNFLAHADSTEDVRVYVEDAYKDIAIFFRKNKLQETEKMKELFAVLQINVHHAGLKTLQSD